MCLKSIKQTFQPNDKMKVGYKVFTRVVEYDGSITYVNIYFRTNRVILMGAAYAAHTEFLSEEVATDGQRYVPLFHIFNSLKGAKTWSFDIDLATWRARGYVICKVIAWDIRVVGTSVTAWAPSGSKLDEIPTFVAKNYRLMEELPWQR